MEFRDFFHFNDQLSTWYMYYIFGIGINIFKKDTGENMANYEFYFN